MFDTINAPKKMETEEILSSLNGKTREEIITLLAKLIRDKTDFAPENERILALKKELESHNFDTDYW